MLPKDEAEHLTRVLRLSVGDTVAIFDGRGHEFLARVASAARRDVRVQLLSRIEPAAEPPVPLTLAQAVLKADKMDEVVRDAVMLGVAAIQPLITKRSETTVAALMRGARRDRWTRVAIASVKQSRRATLPDIRTPLTLEAYLNEPSPPLSLMFVEPGAGASARDPRGPAGSARAFRCRCTGGSRRRMGRGRVDGGASQRRGARDPRTPDIAGRRRADRRDQHPAVSLDRDSG